MTQGMVLFMGLALTLTMFVFGPIFLHLGYFRPEETVEPIFAKIMGYTLLVFGLIFSIGHSSWLEYEVIPPEQYEVEHTKTETVWRYNGMETSSDKKYWAEVADEPDEYCVYVTTGYNLFGMWPGDGMLTLGEPPCEDKGKFEF